LRKPILLLIIIIIYLFGVGGVGETVADDTAGHGECTEHPIGASPGLAAASQLNSAKKAKKEEILFKRSAS